MTETEEDVSINSCFSEDETKTVDAVKLSPLSKLSPLQDFQP